MSKALETIDELLLLERKICHAYIKAIANSEEKEQHQLAILYVELLHGAQTNMKRLAKFKETLYE